MRSNSATHKAGRARPPGASKRPQRKKLPHERPLDYICANPVRAGLIASSEEWPYFWLADPQEKNANREGRAPRSGAPGGRALPFVLSAMVVFSVGCRPDMTKPPTASTPAVSVLSSN